MIQEISSLNAAQKDLINTTLAAVIPDFNTSTGRITVTCDEVQTKLPPENDAALLRSDKDQKVSLISADYNSLESYNDPIGSLPVDNGSFKPDPIPQRRDIQWMLENLASASSSDLIEVGKEIKNLAKIPGQKFWESYSGTIINVLLDHFSFDLEKYFNQSFVNGYVSITGYSPLQQCPSDSSRTMSAYPLSGEIKDRGFLNERMLISSKILLAIAKYKTAFLSNLIEILADRLCKAAAFAPIAVTLHSKQILSIAASTDGYRMYKALLPLLRSTQQMMQEDNICLLALQVLAVAIMHLSASQLILEINPLFEVLLSSLASNLVGNGPPSYFTTP